jgi:hypothetical protein
MNKVRAVERSGEKSGHHRLYRRAAHRALEQLRELQRDLGGIWKEVDAADGGPLLKEYMSKLEDYIVLAAAAQMYCAMATEALLNFYGVCRLGESFYKRNLERLSAVAKLELLIAVCEGELADRGSELSTLLQKIAGRRNDLVHPKAHEYALEDTMHVERGDWPDHLPVRVGAAIDDMECFFQRFASISDDSRAAVEYFCSGFGDQDR